MKKFPKPWRRPSRGVWYATLDGRQINLGPDKDAAFEEYKRLLSQPREKPVESDSLAAVIDAFLDFVQNNRSPETYGWYQYRLQRFIERYPDLQVADLKPYHVQQWADSYEFSKTSRRNYMRSVKTCITWAVRQGYLDRNPLEHLKVPTADSKEVVISQEEFDWLLGQFKDREFRDLLIATWETGCRPQESLRVETRHVDVANQRWVFPPSEGKTGLRLVYLTDTALEITQRLMLKHPEGPLFRNTRGVPWTTDAVNCRFYHLLESEKTHTRYSLYAMRHSWATSALQRGLDPLTVAILLGHKDPSTLSRVYQHLSLSPKHLLKQAKKAAG